MAPPWRAPATVLTLRWVYLCAQCCAREEAGPRLKSTLQHAGAEVRLRLGADLDNVEWQSHREG